MAEETDVNKQKEEIFDSYNAMSRPAMFQEIPVLPLIFLLTLGLLFFVAGFALFNWIVGLVLAFPFLGMLVALRFICSIDPQYPRRLRFILKRLKLNLKHSKNLLLAPQNPNWVKFYGKRYAQERYVSRGNENSTDELSR